MRMAVPLAITLHPLIAVSPLIGLPKRPDVKSSTPSPLKPVMTNPSTALRPALIRSPSTAVLPTAGLSSMSGVPVKPGWLLPRM